MAKLHMKTVQQLLNEDRDDDVVDDHWSCYDPVFEFFEEAPAEPEDNVQDRFELDDYSVFEDFPDDRDRYNDTFGLDSMYE